MLHRTTALCLALLLAPLASAQSPAEATALRYLQDNWNRHGLVSTDVADLVVTDRVPGPNGSEIVYFRQSIDGVEVASGPMTVAVDRRNRVVHAAGRLTPGLAERSASKGVSVSAERAVAALAAEVGVAAPQPFRAVEQKGGAERETVLSDGGVTRLPVRAALVYAEDGGALRLAWETTLFLRSGGDWFGQIDAATGRVIRKEDRLVRDWFGHTEPATAATPHARPAAKAAPATPVLAPFAAQVIAGGGATYRVFPMPIESALYSTPAYPEDGREIVTDPHDALASPFGWHDTDGAEGAEFTVTRGNNTHSYLDRNDDERPDVNGEPEGGESLAFDFPLDMALNPRVSADASVTNLFYWNNLTHDILHRYGFDEASGNFQTNSYGNGGRGNDAVDSESQSGADICNEQFPCETNANMSTPVDGQRPRMQMYVGRASTPETDGSFDNTVIVHEYAHGISNRLVGGPSNVGCLPNFPSNEQMGEGWSDYYGILFTIEPGDARGDRRPVGNLLLGEPATTRGIRPAPYSTDFAINSFTYGDTNSGSLSFPHGVGFVWSTILWEVTWDLIDAHGFDPDLHNAEGTAGNQIMMNLVTTGLKLTPCLPGFVNGRDAILAADDLLYGGAHRDLLWEAFARRGLGFGADQGSSGSRSDQTESFIVPESIPPAAITDLAVIPNGDFVTLTFTATGDDGLDGTAEAYRARYSASPILTEDDWDAATPLAISAEPQPSGTEESVVAIGLAFSTDYHVAVRAVDDSFNLSPLSNSVAVTTLGPPEIQVSTDPVEFVVPEGGETTEGVVVANVGEGDLRVSVDLAGTSTTLRARAARYAESEKTRLDAAPAPLPKTRSKADGPRSVSAPLARKDRGGPDAFGYTWVDSDEPGGPTFEWVDISGTGRSVSLSDDANRQVTLPWAFPFYGTDRTAMFVSSNGFLSFDGRGASEYTNDPIPDTSAPNALIAPYWDDLNPSLGGRIYTQDMGDGRFVVQYQEVPHFSAASETTTFQVILSRSGAITFQYLAMNDDVSDPNSHTIGIENDNGTDGLQVVNNAPYVRDELAIRISSFWGDVTQNGAARVASGASGTVEITADAAGLAPGVYEGTMTLTSNDPDTPQVAIPLRLTVQGSAPTAALSATEVSADVPRGETETRTVTLTNVGGMDLTWTLADAGGTLPPWLSLDTDGGTLTPGESQEIALTMDPGTDYAPGSTEQTTLTLASNDPGGDAALSVTMNVLVGVSTEDDLAFEGPYLLGAVAPNPVAHRATASFAVREAQTVTAEVLDVLGRRVALVHEGTVPALSRQTLTVDAGALASGAYVLVVRGEGFVASRRITVTR